jgi:predicted metal-dependent phosphoesterase TrpH
LAGRRAPGWLGGEDQVGWAASTSVSAELSAGNSASLPWMSGDAPTFDLQSHSRHSDGELAAAEVVSAAASAGVELLALSDHDTVAGVEEAAATARRLGIGLVPAVEISAVDPLGADLHILGYLVDPSDPTLIARLADYRGDRERRTEAMASTLRELGFELDDRVLEARISTGKPIGRPHIAQAVVGHPANAGRLASERLTDPTEFLKAYLIDGRPAFSPREHPSVPEAIATIHDAGGVAVWAHPFWDVPDAAEVLNGIERFRGDGVDGVECFYLTHSEEQTALLVERCAELGMLSTGSSDFHGPSHSHMSAFRAFRTYRLSPYLGPIASFASS